MSKFLDEMEIKSVKSLQKWFKTELAKHGITNIQLECVKVDSYVYVFWAHNNKLLKYEIPACVIYVIQEEDLMNAIQFIKTEYK